MELKFVKMPDGSSSIRWYDNRCNACLMQTAGPHAIWFGMYEDKDGKSLCTPQWTQDMAGMVAELVGPLLTDRIMPPISCSTNQVNNRMMSVCSLHFMGDGTVLYWIDNAHNRCQLELITDGPKVLIGRQGGLLMELAHDGLAQLEWMLRYFSVTGRVPDYEPGVRQTLSPTWICQGCRTENVIPKMSRSRGRLHCSVCGRVTVAVFTPDGLMEAGAEE